MNKDLLDIFMPLIVILGLVLTTIMIVRIGFYILLKVISILPIEEISNNFFSPPKPNSYKKEEDELLRDKKLEIKKEREQQELLAQQAIMNAQRKVMTQNQPFITRGTQNKKVIGKWTRLVLGAGLSRTLEQANSINGAEGRGFVASLREQQRREREQQGRGL